MPKISTQAPRGRVFHNKTFLSPPRGTDFQVTGRVPSGWCLRDLPGRTENQDWGSYTYLRRPFRRDHWECGGVGFGPVGHSGLVNTDSTLEGPELEEYRAET